MKSYGWWLGTAVAVCLLTGVVGAESKAVVLPDPAIDDSLAAVSSQVSLVIAGGCFWGIEELFQHVRGVGEAVSGYSGGSAKNAQYELVSAGTTGHAESVKVTYDPSKVSYGQLLKVFLSVGHDPTQRGGQGPDDGPQYRSVIFSANERQSAIAKAYLNQLSSAGVFKESLTTQVVPLTAFYPAEPYHQDYAAHNPRNPYIVTYDLPKVAALRQLFPASYH